MKEASMFMRLGAIAVGFTAMAAAGAAATAYEGGGGMTREAAADVLKKALETSREAEGPERRIEVLRTAAEEVSKGRPQNILVADALRSPTDPPEADAGKLADRWRTAVADAIEVLEFEVTSESPLPDGFPNPLPIGEIGIQKYPAYRLATTEAGGGGNGDGAFMRLFGHITAKGISMTAPVEMDYSEGENGKSERASMSFLYRNTGQGTLGGEKVKVQDVGEMTVVSLGLRGRPTENRVSEAEEQFRAWLASEGKDYRAAGPIRTLNYNSPFLPAKKQLYEVQIPIEPREPSK
jgi:hypothetical protein